MDPALCFDTAPRAHRCCSRVRAAGLATLPRSQAFCQAYFHLYHPLHMHRWARCVISTETAPPFPGQLPPPCPLTPAPITSYGNGPPASSQAEPARSPLPARCPAPHTALIHGSVFPAKWWDQRAGVGLVPLTAPLHQADGRALLPPAPQAA